MGELRKITCRSCGADWECRTGCGMSHGKLKWVADLYPEDVKSEIQGCLKEGEFVPFEFAYQLSYCKACHGIESVPVLRFEEDDREYVGGCGQCGQRTELIREIEKTQCPVCHAMTLTVEDIGQWD